MFCFVEIRHNPDMDPRSSMSTSSWQDNIAYNRKQFYIVENYSNKDTFYRHISAKLWQTAAELSILCHRSLNNFCMSSSYQEHNLPFEYMAFFGFPADSGELTTTQKD